MADAVQKCPLLPAEDPCKTMHKLLTRGMYQSIDPAELESARTECCKKSAGEIEDMVNRDKRQGDDGGVHGLRHRFREQINGKNGPGTPVWDTHEKQIKIDQKRLRDRLDDFNKGNCRDKQKVPEDAWEWATKPVPKPVEWRNPVPVPVPMEPSPAVPSKGFMDTMAALTGLTGGALLVYVIISEGSRLFPPRNLLPIP